MPVLRSPGHHDFSLVRAFHIFRIYVKGGYFENRNSYKKKIKIHAQIVLVFWTLINISKLNYEYKVIYKPV